MRGIAINIYHPRALLVVFAAAVLLAMALLGLMAGTSLAAAEDTTRVSVSSSGTQANGSSSAQSSISSDGRYVTITSSASNLVADDTNGVADVFVHDRQTGATELVSVDASGSPQANGSSGPSSISSDGRYVVFTSSASNLVGGDTNGVGDVFVRDRDTGTTQLVSVNSSGNQANGDPSEHTFGRPPSISSDGRYVAFTSSASNLVADDNNRLDDVFVRDRDADADGVFDEAGAVSTKRVSLIGAGEQLNGGAHDSAISSNGRYVTYEVDDWFVASIFVYDRQTGATELVSVDSSGNQGDSGSFFPSISSDGRYVAFMSFADNLVVGDDTWGDPDVFVHDRDTGTTQLVNVNSCGTQSEAGGYFPSIDSTGRYIAFSSSDDYLVRGDNDNFHDHIFVHDRDTGTTQRVSVDSSGSLANGSSVFPSISSDGGYVAFESDASNLVADDTNGLIDVFVHERATIPPPDDCDVDAPETTITSGPSGTVNSTSATFEFSSSEANSTFKCKLSGGDWGSGSWGGCNSPWHIGPSLRDASYTVEVYAIDREGNPDPTPASRTWTVTTAPPPPPDTTPPTVDETSLNPSKFQTGVRRNTDIKATFSEEMKRTTLMPSTVKLSVYNKKKGRYVPVTDTAVSCDSSCKTVTLDPYGTSSKLLGANKKYKVTITTAVKDKVDNALAQNYVWTFKTGSS